MADGTPTPSGLGSKIRVGSKTSPLPTSRPLLSEASVTPGPHTFLPVTTQMSALCPRVDGCPLWASFLNDSRTRRPGKVLGDALRLTVAPGLLGAPGTWLTQLQGVHHVPALNWGAQPPSCLQCGHTRTIPTGAQGPSAVVTLESHPAGSEGANGSPEPGLESRPRSAPKEHGDVWSIIGGSQREPPKQPNSPCVYVSQVYPAGCRGYPNLIMLQKGVGAAVLTQETCR